MSDLDSYSDSWEGERPATKRRKQRGRALAHPPEAPPAKKKNNKSPQLVIDEFWAKFKSKHPGKVLDVLPKDSSRKVDEISGPEIVKGEPVSESYNRAAAKCKEQVEAIIKECRRTNQKYSDPDFVVDMRSRHYFNCLFALGQNGDDWEPHPRSAKRVGDIFDDPKFFVNGATSNDIRQGKVGNCWLMSSLCAMGSQPGLIDKTCVALDESIGVYGFVFYRDGEWIFEVIDDKLFLKMSDYSESGGAREILGEVDEADHNQEISSEEAYRKLYQSNSRALYFGKCLDPNETWLPLLEKAYTKAHGDYSVTRGGHAGEGIEDLTGGIATRIKSNSILDKDYFWNEELSKVNKEFLFTLSTHRWKKNSPFQKLEQQRQKGLLGGHSYTILKAVEVGGKRLVLIRNPWGHAEWSGTWGDGSKEWTAEWMLRLDHQFGDDGNFWMSYDDTLHVYSSIQRARLFTDDWKVAQKWTTCQVPFPFDYSKTKFSFTLEKKGPVAIVLSMASHPASKFMAPILTNSKLDERYFIGLYGQYSFLMSFLVQKASSGEHVVEGSQYGLRSAAVEVTLEAGEYYVYMKTIARFSLSDNNVEDTILQNVKYRPDKFQRIARSYDLAHSKAKFEDEAFEKDKKKIELFKKTRLISNTKKQMLKAKKRIRHVENKKKRRKAKKLAKANPKTLGETGTGAAELSKETTESTPTPNKEQTRPHKDPEASHSISTRSKSRKEAEELSQVESESSKPTADGHNKKQAANKGKRPAKSSTEAMPREKEEAEDTPTEKASEYEKVSQDPANPDTKPTVLPKDAPSDIDSDISDVSTDGALEMISKRKYFSKMSKTYKPPKQTGDKDEKSDLFWDNPWNAVITVGLKVYIREGNVEMKVIREEFVPTEEDEQSDSEFLVEEMMGSRNGEEEGPNANSS